MHRTVSEDTVRRALSAIDEDAGRTWLQSHLDHATWPLLTAPWILDVDVTVKPLYGHLAGAVLGYNPKKPGRPSHTYHTYQMAGLRLVLGVEVEAGNQSQSNVTLPGLLELIDRLPLDKRPKCVRGDCGFGNDAMMLALEQRSLPYLFKLKLTSAKPTLGVKTSNATWNTSSGAQAGRMRGKAGRGERGTSSSLAGTKRAAS